MLERESRFFEDIALLELDMDSVTNVCLLEFANDLGDYAIGILA